jgi:hypothetical protein
MTVPLSNKALAILAVVRAAGRPMRAHDIADAVSRSIVCQGCGGSGDPCGEDAGLPRAFDAPDRDRPGCSRCHGRGHLYLDYGTCMAQLKRLRAAGHVDREPVYDAWGDVIGGAVAWRALPAPASDDPLEQAFAAPAARESR